MQVLLKLYRRLDLFQQTKAFRIAASTAVLVICALIYGPLLNRSRDLQVQRVELGRALVGINVNAGDELAITLLESGEITVNGRTYGGADLARRAGALFDPEGTLAAPGQLIEELLADQRPAWAPAFLLEQPGTTLMLAIITVAWLGLIVWMQITIPFLLTLLGTAIPVGLSWAAGSESAMLAFAGMGLLTFTFVLLTRTSLILFSLPHQILAVAHTVVKEATRNRISLVFVVLLLVLLPLLPVWLDPDAPLRFRIQTFISRSLGLTYVLAAFMTLFLSCATVAFEIRDRQIWQLMTKPLNRLNYLLGKWVGILCVNLIILIVAGVSIFTYIKYLSQLPVAPGLEGAIDRLTVRDEILTARSGASPVLDELTNAQIRARVDQQIARDTEMSQLPEVPLATKRRLAREIVENYANLQRSVPPIDRTRPGFNQRTFTFEGLGPAKMLQSSLTLRYRFHIMRDDEHDVFPAAFMLDEDPNTIVPRQYIPTVTHVIPIGTDLIRDDGTLLVTVFNLYDPPPDQQGRGELNFEDGDFELLYKVGSFEANFFRAMVMTWVKLGFLAMLGIACATLLSFPVACLFSFTVFIAGTVGPFLALSLEDYYPPMASQMDWTNIGMVIQWAFQSFIRGTAQGLVFLLRTFGDYRPTQNLVEGRLISTQEVLGGFFWLGVVWSGIALLLGYFIMRSRQLAIYSGHG